MELNDESSCFFYSQLEAENRQTIPTSTLNLIQLPFAGPMTTARVPAEDAELGTTPEEVRKLRKRMLNRKNAKLVRERRMQYIQTLESQVRGLQLQNDQLSGRIRELETKMVLSSTDEDMEYITMYQAIPLTPDQVHKFPVLALEVDLEQAQKFQGDMFETLVSSQANSDVSSPNDDTSSSTSMSSSPNSALFEDLPLGKEFSRTGLDVEWEMAIASDYNKSSETVSMSGLAWQFEL